MKLYEFEGKKLFLEENIEIPKGKTVKSIEEIEYSIDGYDTWKIYLIPKEYSKDSKLQNQLKIKGLNC